ncbi:uncharacterized protein MAM_05897 [Metarhizium album ARSEF 1941]|uniref:Uncharacterized protein n=1 Tax=Metarhizium album (strain ARSEF 1941) TaxID=1081103 RepID=A0A0B2WJV6_METAS|nr:uncharacterized protein MAM_05897 [Metarhizium album ARSEF 1941]KHN96311.1 hypothetical protein MAM_05897 [Metarhizium album ARSEF 1941]
MLRNRAIASADDASRAPIPLAMKQQPSSAIKATPSPGQPGLLSISQIPEWHSENPYIHGGSPPVCAAIAPCVGSWCYLHNQSFNIYTHLIPAIDQNSGALASRDV